MVLRNLPLWVQFKMLDVANTFCTYYLHKGQSELIDMSMQSLNYSLCTVETLRT